MNSVPRIGSQIQVLLATPLRPQSKLEEIYCASLEAFLLIPATQFIIVYPMAARF